MLIKKYFYFLLFSVCFTSATCKHKTDEFTVTVTNSLSFDENPSGHWQVGYSVNNSLDTAQFRLCTFADKSDVVDMWHPAGGSQGYYPYTGQNRDSVTRADVSNSWALRPGEIAMEGSNSGQYSLLRFIVPRSGKYRIRIVFEGVHFRLSTTDVHILLNAKHLFDDIIDGYGGDPAFHAITGSHPSTTYQNTIELQQNDIITFAIGYGANGTFYNDTTGLIIGIEEA